MKIIIISATDFEIKEAFGKLQSTKNKEIKFYTTGVGMLATTVNLCRIIYEEKPTLIIQAGIAGCFNTNEKLGKVYVVSKEFLGDLGVEENNLWKDVFDLKLIKQNQKPFTKKSLINKNVHQLNTIDLEIVSAVSVNQITTNQQIIQQIQKKYSPTLESMEGASLHYVGNSFQIPYIQIRSTSNYIGERNKANWKIELAIKNLNTQLTKLVKKLEV